MAAVDAAGGSTTATTWISGGAATIAVGALAYIAKQFAGGNLVARDTAAAEAQLARTNAQLVDLIADVTKVVRESARREDILVDELRARGRTRDQMRDAQRDRERDQQHDREPDRGTT